MPAPACHYPLEDHMVHNFLGVARACNIQGVIGMTRQR
jgi:hypothetical protein